MSVDSADVLLIAHFSAVFDSCTSIKNLRAVFSQFEELIETLVDAGSSENKRDVIPPPPLFSKDNILSFSFRKNTILQGLT